MICCFGYTLEMIGIAMNPNYTVKVNRLTRTVYTKLKYFDKNSESLKQVQKVDDFNEKKRIKKLNKSGLNES